MSHYTGGQKQAQQNVRIGKYQFNKQNQLGGGGYGFVYLGCSIDNPPNAKPRAYAIKEIALQGKKEEVNVRIHSLVKEINLLRSCSHENIVEFIDAHADENSLYLIMEYCNQGTLGNFIKDKVLSEEEIVNYFQQVLAAIKYLLSKNIYHRDIKLENILMHEGKVKLADFGASRMFNKDDSVTLQMQASITGTLLYLAPEGLDPTGLNGKSDIWSLGVALYFLIYKRIPWSDVAEVAHKIHMRIKQIIDEENSLFEDNTVRISDEMKDIVSRMLTIDPEKRIDWGDLFQYPLWSEYLALQEKLESITLEHRTKGGQQSIRPDIKASDILAAVTSSSSLANAATSGAGNSAAARAGAEAELTQMQTINQQFDITWKIEQESAKMKQIARDQLQVEIDKTNFFYNIYERLGEIFLKQKDIPYFNAQIPNDLYMKCKYLMIKRAAIRSQSMAKIIAFECGDQHPVYVNTKALQTLMRDPSTREDSRIREMVERMNGNYQQKYKEYLTKVDYAENTHTDFNTRSLRKYKGVYYNSEVREDEQLIKCCNENLLTLFRNLAECLITHKEEIQAQDAQERQLVRPFVQLSYNLIIVLAFYSIMKNSDQVQRISQLNLKRFLENIGHTHILDLILRIENTYHHWKNQGIFELYEVKTNL